MDYTYQVNRAITELLKFEIKYNNHFNRYIFKNVWAHEIEETSFDQQLNEIKRLLHLQLKNGLKQVEFLQELLDQIWKKIEWLRDNNSHSSSFINFYSNKILNEEYYNSLPSEELDFENFKSINDDPESNSDLINYLFMKVPEMGNYENAMDFENTILLHSISIYKEALKNIYYYIYTIHMDAEYIDFKNFNLQDLDADSYSSNVNRQLCHTTFDKKSLAHFFKILIEENIIFFDNSNAQKNTLQMKKFVEENFTFRNEKKEQMKIKSFNREYSEASSHQKEDLQKQKIIIEELIAILQSRNKKIIIK